MPKRVVNTRSPLEQLGDKYEARARMYSDMANMTGSDSTFALKSTKANLKNLADTSSTYARRARARTRKPSIRQDHEVP